MYNNLLTLISCWVGLATPHEFNVEFRAVKTCTKKKKC